MQIQINEIHKDNLMDLLRLTLDKLSISGRWWARFERWHYGGEACDAILVVAAESVAAGRSE